MKTMMFFAGTATLAATVTAGAQAANGAGMGQMNQMNMAKTYVGCVARSSDGHYTLTNASVADMKSDKPMSKDNVAKGKDAMDKDAMTRRMLAAVANPFTNVLGHCTGRLIRGGRGTRAQSSFDASAVFAACADQGVAVEINSRPERTDPPDGLISLALETGCLFSIDSDAHAPGQLDFLAYGAERADRLGVPTERIVNTWPLDRLLEWSRAKVA